MADMTGSSGRRVDMPEAILGKINSAEVAVKRQLAYVQSQDTDGAAMGSTHWQGLPLAA